MEILLAEDDKSLSEALVFLLEKEGYSVEAHTDGTRALEALRSGEYSLAILDRMMPGLDGLSLLKALRAEGLKVPVLFLTALGALRDRVEGLDAGADDYLVKPFATEELLARLRVLLRRNAPDESLAAGDIALHAERLLLQGPRESVRLSRREAQLLGVFLQAPDAPQRRDALFAQVWGHGADVEDGNLDSYVHFLRRRLAASGSACRIVTLRGVGYLLETP